MYECPFGHERVWSPGVSFLFAFYSTVKVWHVAGHLKTAFNIGNCSRQRGKLIQVANGMTVTKIRFKFPCRFSSIHINIKTAGNYETGCVTKR